MLVVGRNRPHPHAYPHLPPAPTLTEKPGCDSVTLDYLGGGGQVEMQQQPNIDPRNSGGGG